MAKVHYEIESRKKAQIEEKSNGETSMVINAVVKIKENGETKIDYGKLISCNEKKQTKLARDEYITIVLYIIALIPIVFLIAVLGIAKDLNILSSNHIDELIGIAALLFGVTSIPRVKEFLCKRFLVSRIVKKIWYIIMILFLPFCIIYLMTKFNIPSSISNILGVAGIIISILTW